MASKTIADERIRRLNDAESCDGDYTLYWMQQSQRAEFNHALEFAIQRANETSKRLMVCFGLTDDYPDANLRHYYFMLQGLQQTDAALRRRGIPLIVRLGDPAQVAIDLAGNANEVVCDRGYLRHQRQWREQLAESVSCPVWQVESDAIVPVESASNKPEYAARTIRPKLEDMVDEFLVPLATTPIDKNSLNLRARGIDLADLERLISRLAIEKQVKPIEESPGGTSHAKRLLKRFVSDSLSKYSDRPAVLDGHVSHLSPYLHFGQISPLAVALGVRESRGHSNEQKNAFIEELLVRRELAINFVYYQRGDYDSLDCLPGWAADTLTKHEKDNREYQYTATELENAETHDTAWNAAMLEMKHSGHLHNHMRMYWGKKIIEWTNTVQHAYRVAIDLNNRYFLDGRDANSYANVAWLFGLHDRAHQERKIFGKVRYMSAAGLRRKFAVDRYIKQVADRFEVEIHANKFD